MKIWLNKYIQYIKIHQFKLVKSSLCFASYAGVGGIINLLGVSLVDYEILTGQSFENISYVLQLRSIGYIFGSFSATFIEKYFSHAFILTVSNLTLGSALIVPYWFVNFIPLFLTTLLAAIGLGMLEIYLHVYIGHLWEAESTNYLQVLHIFFDIGALIAPFTTRKLLLPVDIEEYKRQSIGFNNYTETRDLHIFNDNGILVDYPYYMTMGLFLIFVGATFGLLICISDDDEQISIEQGAQQTCHQVLKWKQFVAIGATALIVSFELGAQNLVSALGPAFSVESNLKMTKNEASLLVAVFWITSCVYRFILIPVSFFIKDQYLFVFNVCIMIVGSLVMVQSGDSSKALTWISFILMGIGFSPCFAMAFGLLQKYFTVPGRMASLMFLCGTIGETFHPWIVANYLEPRPTFYTDYFASIAIANSILCLFHVVFVTQIMSQSSRNRTGYREM